MIELQPHVEGVVLAVRAQPGARRNEIRGQQAAALKVGVTQVAEKGKANRALRDFLAQVLKMNRSQVQLLSGETSRDKRFLIRGVTQDQLRQRLHVLISRRHGKPQSTRSASEGVRDDPPVQE